MNIITHQQINQKLCGHPISVEPDCSRIELTTDDTMTVDDQGLVHGGFIFGLADYSAMLAVNDPNVVLGSADVKFLKPVKVGENVVAKAHTSLKKGKKHIVTVTVQRNEETEPWSSNRSVRIAEPIR